MGFVLCLPFVYEGYWGWGTIPSRRGDRVCAAGHRGGGDGVREPVQPEGRITSHGRVLRGDAAGGHGASAVVEKGGGRRVVHDTMREA